MPKSFGDKTRTRVTYGPESHKLMLQFSSDPASIIEEGAPVKLDSANPGFVIPAIDVEETMNVIGYAVSIPKNTAYGEGLTTVACKGFMVVKGVSVGAIPPGPVEFAAQGTGTIQFRVASLATTVVGHAIAGGADGESVDVILL